MYQVSRAIYRELARDIAGGREEQEAVLHTCEATIERMVADAHYFARPARTLFRDLRPYFDIADWPRVWHVVHRYVSATQQALERLPRTGLDANGNPLRCRATTRRGAAGLAAGFGALTWISGSTVCARIGPWPRTAANPEPARSK